MVHRKPARLRTPALRPTVPGFVRRPQPMTETLSGFAALALLGFIVALALLMFFMMLVQPIWCVVDCAVDNQRGTGGKVLWIIVLIVLWGVANWFYGAFAAINTTLRRLTRLAWLVIFLLIGAFLAIYFTSDEFRGGLKKEWEKRGGQYVSAPFTSRAHG